MRIRDRSTKQTKDQELIQGVQKDLQTMSSIPLGGTTYTPGSLVAFIQSRIDAGNEVETTRAAWLKAVHAYQAIDKQADVVVHDLKQFVMGAFGKASPKLADFGFAVPQAAAPTPEQQTGAIETSAATQKATGPKAKRKVTAVAPAANPTKS
ncbi:MAG: hypothetical protein ABSE49_10385 [Polyangiaceae bacterium]